MKKIFLFLFFMTTIANAQIVNIPDANFKARLLAASPTNSVAFGGGIAMKIDANDDGEIQISEAIVLDSLSVGAADIISLDGIASFSNLKKLGCNTNDIAGLLDLSSLVQLRKLDCGVNQITNLNLTGLVNLEYLECNHNQLTDLDFSGISNLEYIEFSANNISSLDVSNQLNLRELICSGNQLTSLNLTGLTELTVLQCSNNQLTELDVSNLNSLIFLYSSQNLLTSLNLTGASALKYLDISNNQLSQLDLNGLDLLIGLGCSFNNIVDLDLSGLTSFAYLSCNNNQISSLNFAGLFNLQGVSCGNNNLTTLDFSENPLLNDLSCSNNNLTYINLKNGADHYNTDNIWSNNENLNFVCVDESEVTIIQQIISQSGLTANVNTYCSFTPAGDYNTITGAVIFDIANDGCDALDLPQNLIRIDINDGTNSGATFINSSGDYYFYTEIGSFTLTPNIENPDWFNFSPVSATIPFTDTNNNIVTQDFCITSNGIHPDLEIVIAPIIHARPGFMARYVIVYKNKGNQVISQLDGIDFSYNQDLMTFISATETPSTFVSGGFSWDLNNMMPFESRSIYVDMQINPPTDPINPVNIGDILQFTASILPTTNDETPADNLFQFNQTVIGSYDPNDITCLEGDVVGLNYVGEYLHYVINFENTGTAEAENVIVKVEINPNDFDINSLRILDTSHEAAIRITNNKLEVIFQGIMLDSGGHGNILLKMATNPGLQVNDFVESKANIYFDYNFPILTNDATTTFAVLSADNFDPINAFKIYPNPVADKLFIQALETIKSVELYDQMGRLVSVNLPNESEIEMDLKQQTPGVYFVKITTQSYTKTEKLLIK